MEEETIAKNNNKREVAESTDETTSTDTLDGERPEMPEDGAMPTDGEMTGENMPMMGGGMPNELMTSTSTSTNEWLIPMTCTGIVSGVMVVATAVICFMIYRFGKKQ